jgi:hypothetical protein
LKALLPPTLGGDVVVTSRYGADWKGIAEPIAVEPLGSEDAARFLLARSGEQDHAAAVALAEVLGGLPLALEQAAAFVAETRIFTLADYHAVFASRSAALLEQGRPDDREHGLDVAFSLLVEQLRDDSSAAVELLYLWRFLPRMIFLGLFLPRTPMSCLQHWARLLGIPWSCRRWCGRFVAIR